MSVPEASTAEQPERPSDRTVDIPIAAREHQGQRAGIVTRLIANSVDALVIFLLGIGLWLGVNALRFFVLDTKHFAFTKPAMFTDIGWLSAIAFAYFTVGWATSGRSYGDTLLGLSVVGRSGGRLNWPLSALRAAFCVVFPILLLWVTVSRDNRSVQDAVLRTSVIYDWNRKA